MLQYNNSNNNNGHDESYHGFFDHFYGQELEYIFIILMSLVKSDTAGAAVNYSISEIQAFPGYAILKMDYDHAFQNQIRGRIVECLPRADVAFFNTHGIAKWTFDKLHNWLRLHCGLKEEGELTSKKRLEMGLYLVISRTPVRDVANSFNVSTETGFRYVGIYLQHHTKHHYIDSLYSTYQHVIDCLLELPPPGAIAFNRPWARGFPALDYLSRG